MKIYLRKSNYAPRIVFVLATALLIENTSLSEVIKKREISTLDGRVYKDCIISKLEADGILIKTDSGLTKIYFTNLPKAIQAEFGYDDGMVDSSNLQNSHQTISDSDIKSGNRMNPETLIPVVCISFDESFQPLSEMDKNNEFEQDFIEERKPLPEKKLTFTVRPVPNKTPIGPALISVNVGQFVIDSETGSETPKAYELGDSPGENTRIRSNVKCKFGFENWRGEFHSLPELTIPVELTVAYNAKHETGKRAVNRMTGASNDPGGLKIESGLETNFQEVTFSMPIEEWKTSLHNETRNGILRVLKSRGLLMWAPAFFPNLKNHEGVIKLDQWHTVDFYASVEIKETQHSLVGSLSIQNPLKFPIVVNGPIIAIEKVRDRKSRKIQVCENTSIFVNPGEQKVVDLPLQNVLQELRVENVNSLTSQFDLSFLTKSIYIPDISDKR